jgi:single-strand DNA-binding protein
MASFNRVVILGNLGQDPEIRYTQNQVPVCTLNIATTDYWTGPDGQRQEQTEWHRVVVWNKAAENCAKYLTKGRSVMVEGKLQTRSWEDKQGQKRYVTEVIAQNVQFVGSGQRERGQAGYTAGGNAPQASSGPDESSVDASSTSMGSSGIGGPETPGLDNIPF